MFNTSDSTKHLQGAWKILLAFETRFKDQCYFRLALAVLLPILAIAYAWLNHGSLSDGQWLAFAAVYATAQIGLVAAWLLAIGELQHARTNIKWIERELDRRNEDYQ